MTKPKKLKVVFAPGAFDDFEGTQEELDALQKEIIDTFSGRTRDEIDAKTKPVDMDTLREEDPELYEILSRRLQDVPRNLQ